MMAVTLSAVTALTLLGVIGLTRHRGGDWSVMLARPDYDDSLRVLDEMFACGEIDLLDYQARRDQLRKLERSG
jgi:hypothetical protein